MPGLTLREMYENFIPDRDDDHVLSQGALAAFLAELEWTVQGKPFDAANEVTKKLVQGDNLFVDSLPIWLYSQDKVHMADPDVVLVLLQNESVGGLAAVAGSKEHIFKTGVRISVLSGNIDVAAKEVTLLYKFLLQREVAFTACGLQVRQLRVVDEPSLVGVDDQSMATYQFRIVLDVVREYPQNLNDPE